MAYSNPTHPYFPYPPQPTPNPSFPSYPHHLHHPSYHSTPYYPYSTNTSTVPAPSPFYSTNTDIITQSPSVCFNRGYTPPTPTLSPSPNPYFPPPTYQQQPQPSYSSFPTPSPLPNSYPSNATPSSTSFPQYFQQQPQILDPSLPPSRLKMKLSIFDGSEDAYWWIICSEKSFNSRNRRVPDAERLMECAFAMKGSALTWWLSWYLANPNISWDSFTCYLLWHFKPEWRPILSIEGEEEEATKEEPTENEEVPEPLEEEETAFIESVQEQTVEETKKLFDGGDLQIIQEKDNEKEQESEPHHDFQTTSRWSELTPPPFISTLSLPAPKSPEPDTFIVACKLTIVHPSPLKQVNTELNLSPPPPKPPDLLFDIIYTPPLPISKPPDIVSCQNPAPRPPSKPPDMHLSPRIFQFSLPIFLST
ncbi:hypothetical protein QL285_057748 [Trifolium repens]|nr:hypothetical protein QL285_057748 [Trifolium repens]